MAAAPTTTRKMTIRQALNARICSDVQRDESVTRRVIDAQEAVA